MSAMVNAGLDIRTNTHDSDVEVVDTEFTQHRFLRCVTGNGVGHFAHKGLNALFIDIDCHHVVPQLIQGPCNVTAESAQSNHYDLLLSFHRFPRSESSPLQFKYTETLHGTIIR